MMIFIKNASMAFVIVLAFALFVDKQPDWFSSVLGATLGVWVTSKTILEATDDN